ncbi:MAG: alpha/beta hydrolase family protein [Verrucomicrobiales bacterium]
MRHRSRFLPILLCSLASILAVSGQDIATFLKERVISPETSMKEVQDFCRERIKPLKKYSSIQQWEEEAKRLRQAVLDQVILRGEAADWNKLATRVEWLETIEGGHDYQIRKFRYEVIPGLWAPGLLYQPKNLSGKVPVALNVNGHDPDGKAAPYKQTRCINQAKRGMLAMNLEWIGMGQLGGAGYDHYKMNQLDLVGTSGVAPFYFGLKRGLDILLEHPNADTNKVAVTGLSGGAWQTIFISGLDERVTLANPVAGYSSFFTRAEHLMDLGDSEQTPSDLASVADYLHLTAMRAPRPTLLTYNAKDGCCFRADHALEPLLQGAQPFYDLYGKGSNLRSHINHDPGTHNFEKDNRQQLYKMLGDHFYSGDATYSAEEIPCDREVKTKEQLEVPLPSENATFNEIAKTIASRRHGQTELNPETRRATLAKVVKWKEGNAVATKQKEETIDGIQAIRYSVRISDHWTIPAVSFIPKGAKEAVLLVSDEGRESLAKESERFLGEGKAVIAIDPFFFGESKIASHDFLFALLVASVGERPLGIQASQIAAAAKAIQKEGASRVTIYAKGPRLGLAARIAAALAPDAIAECQVEGELASLSEILNQNWAVNQKPELFCFGLLSEFELADIKALGALNQ